MNDINDTYQRLETILCSIENYNSSDDVNYELEQYLSQQQHNLSEKLKNYCFGQNVYLLIKNKEYHE